MSMIMAWYTLNTAANLQDRVFGEVLLVVSPGITILKLPVGISYVQEDSHGPNPNFDGRAVLYIPQLF